MERALTVVVISDVHLGTYGCQAKELLNYLQSIRPEILVLNGDFIDGWQFSKRYFPAIHIEVIYEVMRKAMNGTKVYYLSGNHDDFVRKFIPFYSGNIYFRDKLELEIEGKRHLFFHGDVFDISIQVAPILAKIGGLGYNNLIRFNTFVNILRIRFGFERVSFAHKVKTKIKQAISYIKNFEAQAVDYGIKHNAQFVICGHIHIPCILNKVVNAKDICYMNSGDWVENLSSLELNYGIWSIYNYEESEFQYLNKHLIFRDKPVKVFSELISADDLVI